MGIQVEVTSAKSRGHNKNEDSYFIGDNFWVIADGMGGECDGDVASKIAIDTISQLLSKGLKESLSEDGLRAISYDAIKAADSKISDYINQNPMSDGMGTTVLIAVKIDEDIFVSWCGDSHCYLYSNGHLESITKDHSYVQELIDTGEISVQESYTHPDNNIITRYVGGGEEWCIPDFKSHRMQESDILILCSDGLSGYCTKAEIKEAIDRNSNIVNLPNELWNLAVMHGSEDDITVLVGHSSLLKKPKSSLFGRLKGMW